MAAAARLEAAKADWPGREVQLASLTALLGRPRDAAACIAVSGPPGSGKTGCVRACWEGAEVRRLCSGESSKVVQQRSARRRPEVSLVELVF